MKIDKHIFRQADFIERALDNLEKALRDGAILVVIVVLVFLMNIRAAAITLVAIPLSLVAAVLTMNYFGFTLNSMSLGGLAIAIGELVDDAIIDVENVVRRLRENAQKPEGERSARARYRLHGQYGNSRFRRVRDTDRGSGVPALVLSGQRGGAAAAAARLRVHRRACGVARHRADRYAGIVLLLLPRAKNVLSGREPWLVHRLKSWYQPVLELSLRHPTVVLGCSRRCSCARRWARSSSWAAHFCPSSMKER